MASARIDFIRRPGKTQGSCQAEFQNTARTVTVVLVLDEFSTWPVRQLGTFVSGPEERCMRWNLRIDPSLADRQNLPEFDTLDEFQNLGEGLRQRQMPHVFSVY